MKYLSGAEKKQAMYWIDEAAKIAKDYALCYRSKCGSIIVNDKKPGPIGIGFNAPPDKKPLETCIKDSLPKNFKSERHCCVHAEQMAIMDALERRPEDIVGSTLYFIRLDANGNKTFAGKPYCTICSKMALRAKIAEFVLLHKKGVCVYSTEEYNKLSFQFKGD